MYIHCLTAAYTEYIVLRLTPFGWEYIIILWNSLTARIRILLRQFLTDSIPIRLFSVMDLIRILTSFTLKNNVKFQLFTYLKFRLSEAEFYWLRYSTYIVDIKSSIYYIKFLRSISDPGYVSISFLWIWIRKNHTYSRPDPDPQLCGFQVTAADVVLLCSYILRTESAPPAG